MFVIAFPRRRLALLSLPIAGLALAPATQAAWEYIPEVSLTAETDDNPLMETTDKRSASRTTVEAGVRLSSFGTRGDFYVAPAVSGDFYAGSRNADLETRNKFLTMGGNRQWRTVAAGFQSSLSREGVLRAEFAGIGPTDPDAEAPIDVETGRIAFFQSERDYLLHRGNIDFRLSDRNTLRFDLQRMDVTFSQPPGAQAVRRDFETNSFGMQLARQVDPRNQVSAQLLVSEFSAPGSDNKTDVVSLEGRFNRPLTQTWNFGLAMGVNRTDFTLGDPLQGARQTADTDYSFAMRLRKRSESASWNFDFTRNLSPNGSGFIMVRQELRAYLRQRFSPRLVGNFGVRAASIETAGSITRLDDRDFTRLDVNFEWAMKRTLFLLFGVDSYTQKFAIEDESPTSNTVFFGVTYKGLSRRNP